MILSYFYQKSTLKLLATVKLPFRFEIGDIIMIGGRYYKVINRVCHLEENEEPMNYYLRETREVQER